jgi:thiol-disulfide isomerase/thioredoxin
MKRTDFFTLLNKNESIIIVFFTGKNCAPCEKVKPYVTMMEKKVSYSIYWVDNETDLYSAMKAKGQLKGVPSLLAYKKGNTSIIADLSISGSNLNEVETFFEQLEIL